MTSSQIKVGVFAIIFVASLLVMLRAQAQSKVFTWNEQRAGDCHTRSGARLELLAAPGGYTIHYIAQMYTDKAISGDVWHVTWQFKDAAGNVLLTSPQIDLPDGGARMHPQFGNYNIDHTSQIGPDTQPHISQVINSVRTVTANNAC